MPSLSLRALRRRAKQSLTLRACRRAVKDCFVASLLATTRRGPNSLPPPAAGPAATGPPAPRGGRAVIERLQEVAVAPLRLRRRDAQERDHLLLEVAPVDADRAGTQLPAVADQVVVLGARRAGVGLDLYHFPCSQFFIHLLHQFPPAPLFVPGEKREV